MKKILLLISLVFILSSKNSFAVDSCIVSGPASVITNNIVFYTTAVMNLSWEVYSYNGAQAQLIRVSNETLFVNTGPTVGNYTIYKLGFPNYEVLCSLNVSVDASLPVELNSFTSTTNGRDVTLNWSTAAEKNNFGFEVERSSTENSWATLKFISGGGNKSTLTRYTFEDRNLSSGKYKYRLKQKDYNGNFEYYNLNNEVIIGTPEKYSLSQNYPNPFNPETKINYDIASDGIARIQIFDASGKQVSELVNEFKEAGYYTTSFNGAAIPSGIYFIRMESGNFSAVKKMMLIK